jgi:hypothetical protein
MRLEMRVQGILAACLRCGQIGASDVKQIKSSKADAALSGLGAHLVTVRGKARRKQPDMVTVCMLLCSVTHDRREQHCLTIWGLSMAYGISPVLAAVHSHCTNYQRPDKPLYVAAFPPHLLQHTCRPGQLSPMRHVQTRKPSTGASSALQVASWHWLAPPWTCLTR